MGEDLSEICAFEFGRCHLLSPEVGEGRGVGGGEGGGGRGGGWGEGRGVGGGEGGGGWGIEIRVSHRGLVGIHENSLFIYNQGTKTINACASSSNVVHKHDK